MQNSVNIQSMLKVGTILRGTYRIDSYLSSGGFGNTYIATNIEFEERVAIKEFFMKGVTQRTNDQTTVCVSNSDNIKSFGEQKEKFKKEARRIRQLDNAHIVAVHDLFEENGTAYYVMDYIEGENLAERLKRTEKPIPEQEVVQILSQILNALKSVHNAGIWHLDLKPANIMIDKNGNVKLIDFGASKQLNTQKGGATTSTAISYTNGYAPREQMEQNYDKFGPWTDIYALGATLYNLLTNKRPPLPTDIDDDNSEDKHIALPLPINISNKMKEFVLWLIKTNRTERPQSVSEVIEQLNVVTEKISSENPDKKGKYNIDSQLFEKKDIDESTIVENQETSKQQVKEDDKEERISSLYLSSKSFRNTVRLSSIIGIVALCVNIMIGGVSTFLYEFENVDLISIISCITCILGNICFGSVLIPFIFFFRKKSYLTIGLLLLIEFLLLGNSMELLTSPIGFYFYSPKVGVTICLLFWGVILTKRCLTNLKYLGYSITTCSCILLSIFCITSLVFTASNFIWFIIWIIPIFIAAILLYLLQWFALQLKTNEEVVFVSKNIFPVSIFSKRIALSSFIGVTLIYLSFLLYSIYITDKISDIQEDNSTIIQDSIVIDYPTCISVDEGLELRKVVLTNSETRLDFDYVNLYEGGWCSIDRKAYLRSSSEQYELRSAKGIEVSPKTTNFSFIGQGLSFSLYFPPINKKIEKIDFIENDSSSWFITDIHISNQYCENRDSIIKGLINNMVYIPSASFTMGNDAWVCSAPSHKVTLSDYYIGRYEVSQREWEAVMPANPSTFKNPNNPVDGIYWEGAQRFLSKLSKITGKKFRLPTEAEWEYAARGGSKSKAFYFSGSNKLTEVAWFSDNSNGRTHPIGEKEPNALGLYDMSGNVWEWCYDTYSNYSAKNEEDPVGLQKGNAKVIRGGSYNEKESINKEGYSDFWPYARNSEDINKAFNNVGFRIVMEK